MNNQVSRHVYKTDKLFSMAYFSFAERNNCLKYLCADICRSAIITTSAIRDYIANEGKCISKY